MAEQGKKGRRGGRREGAGRPKGTARTYNFRADSEVADCIDRQENKTDFIRGCIRFAMRHQGEADQQLRQEAKKTLSLRHEANQPLSLKHEADQPLAKFGEVTPATRLRAARLPFFDVKIVAGFPIPMNKDEMAQDIELLQMLCPHPDSSYLIRVLGDSMVEADVKDGDILIVDKSLRHPTESQIAVCELNGEYTVKHVVRDCEGMWLVPANPAYPRIRVAEGDDFSVWGVVTYIIHKSR
ncbi:MAG: LexA family transcriptional regulator [Bacteroidaceae bacterium]|nr:LexA family transcriptional regulator [Bacteroidaceae bacterium]